MFPAYQAMSDRNAKWSEYNGSFSLFEVHVQYVDTVRLHFLTRIKFAFFYFAFSSQYPTYSTLCWVHIARPACSVRARRALYLIDMALPESPG